MSDETTTTTEAQMTPWIYDRDEGGIFGDDCIALLTGSRDECDANGSLMAAAPALRDALASLLADPGKDPTWQFKSVYEYWEAGGLNLCMVCDRHGEHTATCPVPAAERALAACAPPTTGGTK